MGEIEAHITEFKRNSKISNGKLEPTHFTLCKCMTLVVLSL